MILISLRLVLLFLPPAWLTILEILLSDTLEKRPFQHISPEGNGIKLKEKLEPNEWEDIIHFEGNANAFRLLTHQFEGRRKGGFAMNLFNSCFHSKISVFHRAWLGKNLNLAFLSLKKKIFKRIATELGIICLNENPLKFAPAIR